MNYFLHYVMQKTRKYFTQDELLEEIHNSLLGGLEQHKVPETIGSRFSNVDCLKGGIALFTFKFSSLLKFDTARWTCKHFMSNMQRLFGMTAVPCDTYMRERLDEIVPVVVRRAYTRLFTLLQRNRILDNFRFFKDYYLVSLDGTGVFSSKSVYCEHCCTKNHKDGSVTYHHQILAAALVHPDQKVVYPFCSEPIIKADGETKNDCERNAAKRWVKDFRREHPHLKTVILGDGLSSNEPFISTLVEHDLSYILVCKEGDHTYLTDWVNAADSLAKPGFCETSNGITRTFSYIENVPLNESKNACRVTVVSLLETKKGKTTKWMWVTDLAVNLSNIKEFTKGARARWKIENETFNTLKNQGYEFEHNFGHGNKYLTTVFTHLMMLAFFIDQCLQHVNKRFQDAVSKWKSKSTVWEQMRNYILICDIPDFETLYHIMVHPPPLRVVSVK